MSSEIIIVPIIFLSFVAIIKILSDNRVRNKLIEKGLVDENIQYLYPLKTHLQKYTSLKWGIVLIFVGLAIFISQLLAYKISDESIFGIMFLFAGLGLVLYYFLASKMQKQDNAE